MATVYETAYVQEEEAEEPKAKEKRPALADRVPTSNLRSNQETFKIQEEQRSVLYPFCDDADLVAGRSTTASLPSALVIVWLYNRGIAFTRNQGFLQHKETVVATQRGGLKQSIVFAIACFVIQIRSH